MALLVCNGTSRAAIVSSDKQETPKPIKKVDYFPLMSGCKYVYRCTYRGKDVFRSLVVKKKVADEGDIFYFVRDSKATTV